MLIDLQLHSTCSDGYLTPTELAQECKKRNIKVASLTDHNTVSGQEEFFRACRKANIKTVAGMELYVKLGHRHFNMLWYNLDIENPELHNLLRDSQSRRRANVRKALERLARLRYAINTDLDSFSHYIPLNRIVDEFYALNKERLRKELGKKNIIEPELVRYYFRSKEKTFLHESYIDFNRIAKLKKNIGGQFVLAHPCRYIWLREDKVAELKQLGIDGVEVLSPHHSWGAVSYLQALTDQYKLIMSGGSDFHRFEEERWYRIKSSWNYFEINSKLLKGVEKIIG